MLYHTKLKLNFSRLRTTFKCVQKAKKGVDSLANVFKIAFKFSFKHHHNHQILVFRTS